MASVTIYGASDDLIEVEGAIREEFTPHESNYADFLAFSDGTVLSVKYGDEGIWRINRVASGSAHYEKTEGVDDDNYSDRVTLTGDIAWCVFGSRIEKIKGGAP